mmetsp:Transcript_34721/g.55760  ORF Transcript_34721/g.55760 Transcript_34721/m.55760 type:complete len:294 (-) Transcript_34721:141-1022(-)
MLQLRSILIHLHHIQFILSLHKRWLNIRKSPTNPTCIVFHPMSETVRFLRIGLDRIRQQIRLQTILIEWKSLVFVEIIFIARFQFVLRGIISLDVLCTDNRQQIQLQTYHFDRMSDPQFVFAFRFHKIFADCVRFIICAKRGAFFLVYKLHQQSRSIVHLRWRNECHIGGDPFSPIKLVRIRHFTPLQIVEIKILCVVLHVIVAEILRLIQVWMMDVVDAAHHGNTQRGLNLSVGILEGHIYDVQTANGEWKLNVANQVQQSVVQCVDVAHTFMKLNLVHAGIRSVFMSLFAA